MVVTVHACEGQKAFQSTLKAYQDGSLHQGGLLDTLQLPFPLLQKELACQITGQEADGEASSLALAFVFWCDESGAQCLQHHPRLQHCRSATAEQLQLEHGKQYGLKLSW